MTKIINSSENVHRGQQSSKLGTFFHRLYAATSFWYLRRRPLVATRENAATSSYRPCVWGCRTNIKTLWWKWHVTGWFLSESSPGDIEWEWVLLCGGLFVLLPGTCRGRRREEVREREGQGGVGSPKLVNNTGSCNKLPAQRWHPKFAIDLSIPAWAEQLNLEIQQREQW